MSAIKGGDMFLHVSSRRLECHQWSVLHEVLANFLVGAVGLHVRRENTLGFITFIGHRVDKFLDHVSRGLDALLVPKVSIHRLLLFLRWL